MNHIEAEEPTNYEQKCPCVLVIDVSGSMADDSLEEVNKGLVTFKDEILEDPVARLRVELAIVTFGSDANIVREFSSLDEYEMPELTISGLTNMVAGFREGLSLIGERKAYYRESGQQYYRPYLILVTDGIPTNTSEEMEGLKSELAEGVEGKHYNVWSFGVTGADMQILNDLNPGHAKYINDSNFNGFFKWLSASFKVISRSKEGDTPDLSPEKLTPDEKNLFQHEI